MSLFLKIVRRIEVTILYFFGKIRSLWAPGKFGIKRGYSHRKEAHFYDDTPNRDECQKEVYELARFYLDKYGYQQVLDIGCGSGYKLLQQFADYPTVGVEVGATLAFLQQKYPNRTWIDAARAEQIPRQTDLIICSDVIEHVANPDEMLELIKKIDFKLLFLSTPDRDLVRGWYNYGPPENKCHTREWNTKEFRRYVAAHFDIISHQITHVEDATQLLICKKK